MDLDGPIGFFFVLLFVSLASGGDASGALSPQELNALRSLRNQLGLRAFWGPSESPCHWTGITCQTLLDRISPPTRVARIVLESKGHLDEDVPLSLSRSTGERLRFSGTSGRGVLPSLRFRENYAPKRLLFNENWPPPSPPLGGSTNPRNNPSRSSVLPLSPAPSPQPHQQSRHKHNHRFSILGFAIGSLLGMVFGVIFSVVGRIIVMIVRGRNKQTGPIIYSPLIEKAEHLAFLETEEGVASLEIIGRGGCGEVYKGELAGSNGKLIAIKKVYHPPTDLANLTEEDTKNLDKKMRQIKSELETVGHIRHWNLLPLLASVARPECHFLIYEYMKNGSLQNALTDAAQGRRELGWLDRHRIALGIAAGLKYLHFHHSPRIIHRDLKPANVLLDDDLEPKIADFGLAKSVPDMNTHATTSNVAGTVGYIAPEYYQSLKFTDKCDIYSFGVVLAVMVTGKQPTDEFFQHTKEVNMVKWLKNMMSSNNPAEAIDPKLADSGFVEQMLLVLKIACFCTWEEAKERPNSKDVHAMLAQIKN